MSLTFNNVLNTVALTGLLRDFLSAEIRQFAPEVLLVRPSELISSHLYPTTGNLTPSSFSQRRTNKSETKYKKSRKT